MGEKKTRPWFVCPECGSDKVKGTVWIDVNTGEIQEGQAPFDHYWCDNCEETTGEGETKRLKEIQKEVEEDEDGGQEIT